jgi:ATP-binding cassette subfamily F protein uup
VCNEIELDNGKIYQYKGNYSYYLEKKEERIASENASVDKAKPFVKELEWMRRQPKARTTKSKSSGRFYDIKEKAQSRRKENRGLKLTWSAWGKIIELHKISKNLKTTLF